MTISEMKKQILKWRDFYGGSILDESEVEKAKTKKELKNILNSHGHFMEMQAIDAQSHLDNFKNKLGLNHIW